MEESGHEGHRTTRRKAEMEELWAANGAQESRITGMVCYHAALRAQQKKTQTDYNIKRSKKRELQAELTRHHKHRRAGPWTKYLPRTGIVQDQWMAEEVEEHLTAARTINEQQQQATREITSAHRMLD